ncbi:MAG TPA: hypothetical protein PLJ21_00805 [Pseudobdellovibrionaceae bacterium]|nr:hypothetical protein [Pseudobdellovibrionaceae bacterium]
MKKAMRTIFGLSLGLGLSACDEVEFKTALEVTDSLTLVSAASSVDCDTQVDWWNCSEEPDVLNLNPGQYKIKARLGETRTTTKLILEIPQAKGSDKVMTIESSRKLSNSDQSFSLTPEEIHQDFTLNGAISTQRQDGPMQTGYQSCTYYTREYVCREVRVQQSKIELAKETSGNRDEKDHERIDRNKGDRNNGGHNNGDHRHNPPTRTVCGYESVGHAGQEYVEYHMQYTTKTLALSFVKSEAVVARSYGTWQGQDRVYTHRGTCQ